MNRAVLRTSSTLIILGRTHRLRLLRLAMICAVLAVAPLAGIFVVRLENPVLVFIAIAAPLGALGMQYILPRSRFGPLAILFAAAFVPISLPTGTESRLVDSFLLTLLFVGHWLAAMLLVDKRFSVKPSPVNKPLFGFILVTLFSIIWSTIFRDPLVDPALLSSKFAFVQVASALTIVMLPGAFLLVNNQIDDLRLLKAMVALMLLAGGLGLIRQYGLAQIPININGLFSMWIISLSTGLALYIRRMHWFKRVMLLAVALAWIYWGFGLNITWLAGWLPGFVALAVLSFMRSRVLFIGLLILFVIFIGVNADYYLGNVIEAEANESGHSRMEAWAVNWRVTEKHLLFGTGPAGYAAYYMSYFPDDAMATHSNYIDVLAQFGVIGFAFYVWFFIVLAWRGYKLCIRLRGRGDFSEGLANAAFAGTVSGIISMGFGDWLLPFTYTQTIAGFDYAVYNWLLMGMILVLERLTLTESGSNING